MTPLRAFDRVLEDAAERASLYLGLARGGSLRQIPCAEDVSTRAPSMHYRSQARIVGSTAAGTVLVWLTAE